MPFLPVGSRGRANRRFVAARKVGNYTGNEGFLPPSFRLVVPLSPLMRQVIVSTDSAPVGRRRLPWLPLLLLALVAIFGLTGNPLFGQAPAAPQRPLAPGVLTTIPPNFNPEETVSTHDIVEVRAD